MPDVHNIIGELFFKYMLISTLIDPKQQVMFRVSAKQGQVMLIRYIILFGIPIGLSRRINSQYTQFNVDNRPYQNQENHLKILCQTISFRVLVLRVSNSSIS